MTFLLLFIGLAPATLAGTLLVCAAEGKHPTLTTFERLALGLVLGPTLSVLPVFLADVAFGVPLTRWSFLASSLLLIFVGAAIVLRRPKGAWLAPAVLPRSPRLPRAALCALIVLLSWTGFKAMSFGATNLLLTPTYLDDTLDNWNLRAKVFFTTQHFTLDLPHADPQIARVGVSSYPPAIPLLKASLAALGGGWNESAANGLHLLWCIAPLLLFWAGLRRICGTLWAFLGVYALASLPLFLIHMVSPYADAFLATHLLAAALPLVLALRAATPAERMAWLRIGALMAGILPFTKNEASVLYLPALLAAAASTLAVLVRSKRLDLRAALRGVAWYAVLFCALGLPWLAYKWSLGLAFGNAKAISSLAIAWNSDAPQAIVINTLFEGNWLIFFPLLALLLAVRWRDALCTSLLPLSVAALLAYMGQLVIFTCTPLALEAIRQTGYARGVTHLIPILLLLALTLAARLAAPALPAWARPTEEPCA